MQKVINSSRQNNPEEGVTGCLLTGSNSYLQLLEGPSSSVDKLYFNINADERHKGVKKLNDEKIDTRLFSSWSMKLAPFDNLEWSDGEFDVENFLNITTEKTVNIFTSINEYRSM